MKTLTAKGLRVAHLNAALPRMSIRTGKTLASMTAWICCRLPAVMLLIVQHASFLTLSFIDVPLSNDSRHGSTEQFSITCSRKTRID